METKQFDVLETILYHLLPGLPILFVAIICANPVWGLGLPIFLSLMVAIALALIPTELGILLFAARREGKRIKNILGFQERMPLGKTVLWALPYMLFSMAAFMLLSGVERPLWNIFDWVPEWFRIDRFDIGSMSPAVLAVTIALNFVMNGILGPLVEELYFRGFLLPRMGRFGKTAPLANAVLFSLYHFFTPWENVTRIIALVPYIYVVWHKRDIRIGIFVHCTLNTLSAIGMLATVLQR